MRLHRLRVADPEVLSVVEDRKATGQESRLRLFPPVHGPRRRRADLICDVVAVRTERRPHEAPDLTARESEVEWQRRRGVGREYGKGREEEGEGQEPGCQSHAA